MNPLGRLQTRIGPLRAWQWGALVGGAALGYRLIASRAGGQPSVFQIEPLPEGTFTSKTSPQGLGGGLLDELSHFICTMPNAPNSLQLSLPDGTVMSLGNGIGTFGQVGTVTGATDSVWGSQYNPCAPPQADTGGNGDGNGNGNGNTNPPAYVPPTTYNPPITLLQPPPGGQSYLPPTVLAPPSLPPILPWLNPNLNGSGGGYSIANVIRNQGQNGASNNPYGLSWTNQNSYPYGGLPPYLR
jgi:hypothetical protein